MTTCRTEGSVGGKARVQIIGHAVHQKAFAFPVKIVMVRDGGQAGLDDEFGQRQPQRNVHRNRQRVFDDQQLHLKIAHEGVELLFEMFAQFVNALRDEARPDAARDGLRVDGVDFGIAARFSHL